MKSKLFLILASLGLVSLTTIGAVSASWAVSDNAAPFGIKISLEPPVSQHSVTFYKAFSNGEWTNSQTIKVNHGETLTAPVVSVTGYTTLGWNETKPCLSCYTPYDDFTVDNINKLPITKDMVLYPNIESNNNRVYISSLGYIGDADTDITLNVNSIGQTLIGKQYLGVTNGMCNPIASWNTNRSLYSGTGVYKFSNEGGAAACKRKVILSISNVTWWTNDRAATRVHAWDGSGNSKDYDFAYNAYSNNKLTVYIDATLNNLMVMRLSENKSQEYNKTVDGSVTSHTAGSNNYSSVYTTYYIESSTQDGKHNYSWYS